LLYKLIKIAESSKRDTEKVLKGEKIPGARVRKKMQDIKMMCEIIRDMIQVRFGLSKTWKECRVPALERLIKEAQESLEKEKKMIEKRKKERREKIALRNQQKREEK
jgi:hypothetical protein